MQLGYGEGEILRGEGILAITKALLQSGVSYVGGHRGYRVHAELSGVFKKAGIEGRTPYDLRHTFLTVAEGARDLPAVQSIMGHAASGSDMAARYREGVSDERLIAVTSHVRRCLFPPKRKAK